MCPDRAPLIAVLGSVNMDLVTTTERRPAPGETVLGTGFRLVPGGKGANQAIAAARSSGHTVEFLGAVGDDLFAAELRRVLADSGVGTGLLRTVAGPSGVAAIVVDGSGENSIIVVGGANATLTTLTAAELDVIAKADILLCQLEIPVPTVAAAARHARANGTMVMLNPSPAQPLPDELWANVDIAVVNSGEAEQLGGTLDKVTHLVITQGAAGATYRGPGGESQVPSPRVEVVDTTGAGDTFTGALAAAWHRGPERALAWASTAGALATTKLGASSSIPARADIAAALAGEQ
ncbi:ribokinase [Nocardia arthritidis]|uniref:Ribokinase n=1 Tax=Nocardia arthritidis TaxID=228602 RepID=A0A6G9YAU8_9NOCA|nr:ribokinase [Nocardia arthritidis]QIS10250.1 ribokinase [Nocardia arthritidis]